MTGRVEFSVKDADLNGVVLTTVPGVEVTGAFTLEGGDWNSLYALPSSLAAPNAANERTPPKPAFLPSVGLQYPEQGLFGSKQVNRDGTFKLLPAAGARNYQLNITGLPQGTYIKSVHYGAQDVTRSMLKSERGQHADNPSLQQSRRGIGPSQ